MKILTRKDIRKYVCGDPVVKNLPCNAGDIGSIPGQGTRIPHTEEQLSQRATATEPAHSRAHETRPLKKPLEGSERSLCGATKYTHGHLS